MPLSFVTLLAAALAAILLYFAAVLFYRLHFHPLAGFPGPKLAAISNLYEFYYDVWLQGQFTMHLLDLHARYGIFSVFLRHVSSLIPLPPTSNADRSHHPYLTRRAARQ